MFNPKAEKHQIATLIGSMNDNDFARFMYCQQMAATYLAVAKFEDMLINAMQMCDRIRVQGLLGSDSVAWDWMRKRQALQGSTIGSLVKILEKHGFPDGHLNYLKWIKDKRDYFVHRLFHDGAWPGDLDAPDCRFMARRLIAIQILLSRAEKRIWYIFQDVGLVEVSDLGPDGMLIMNADLWDARGEFDQTESPSMGK